MRSIGMRIRCYEIAAEDGGVSNNFFRYQHGLLTSIKGCVLLYIYRPGIVAAAAKVARYHGYYSISDRRVKAHFPDVYLHQMALISHQP